MAEGNTYQTACKVSIAQFYLIIFHIGIFIILSIRSKHILFLTDNYPPEGNAPATRTHEHAKEWVKLGCNVTVITTAPNFPEGKVFPGYANKWFHKENIDGVNVHRVKTYITANQGFLRRILDYMSFMIVAFFAGLFVKKVDVVVATSPQFFTAIAGFAISVIKRKPFIFELRDIWPASITAVGAMKKTIIIIWLERVEMFLYRKAYKIIAVTYSFKKELIERGIDAKKIHVVLNGVDLDNYMPSEKDSGLVAKYAIKNKFVVGYIGTHGMAHALDTIVEAAEILKGKNNILFLFAGGGAESNRIADLVKSKNLTNVMVLGRQDKKIMPKIWSLCDVSLIHLRNAPLFKTVIPSKIFESMAMGLPILIGMPKGEATDLVTDAGAGIRVEPENSEELSLAIMKLYNDEILLDSFSKSAEIAAKSYDRKKLALKMLNYIS